MADTMQFDLVSPERKLVSVAAQRVQIPGMDGDFTAMPKHSPLMTTLRPGIVSVTADGAVTDYVVTGGFADITPTGTTVLAEEAVLKGDVDRAWLDRKTAEIQANVAIAEGDALLLANLRLNDLAMLGKHLGL
jgi:F-type H+-transporting ATPase subunit epsilon